MPALRYRSLRCFYCNTSSRNAQPGIPREWTCPYCEAVNHLDKNGQITDPPAYAVASSPSPPLQYARERSPPMASPKRSIFCKTCQHNQNLVNHLMAEYIPDEDDPDYKRHIATADAYKAELEVRYPPVCENCIGQVRDQVRAAGYTAKTDHLRRILEQSKQSKKALFTPRQMWTLRAISLAKWTYVTSVSVGLVWHTLGSLAIQGHAGAPQAASIAAELPFWAVCLTQLTSAGCVDYTCFQTSTLLSLVKLALTADFLTLWWNPKLKQKTNRPGGRMHGLIVLWLVRILVLGSRILGFMYFANIPPNDNELRNFNITHGILLSLTFLSILASWKAVRIEYQSTKSFMQPLDPYLPNVPLRKETSFESSPFQTVRPKADVYDTMAQSFTTSFQENDEETQLPPSPTATATTFRTYDDSEAFTPYAPSRFKNDEDDMDWTPTRKRFGKDPIEVQPPLFQKQPQNQAPPPKEPHSIFAKRDPNPFRNKVPEFPKGPTQQKRNPWTSGIWKPAPDDTKKTFLNEVMQKGGADGETRQRLRENVPKNVKNQAELFKKPQLKYDYIGYVGEKTTGLEDNFNNLFKK